MMNGRLISPVFSLAFCLCSGWPAWANPTPSANPGDAYLLTQWKSGKDLPQNTVQSLCQTRDGYLWIGTALGLARFDGLNFTIFDKRNTPALAAADNCLALAEDDAGSLWIGTAKGLVRYRRRAFAWLAVPPRLMGNRVAALARSRSGGIWIGTDTGLFRYRDGRFTDLAASHGNAVLVESIWEDDSNTPWIYNGTAGWLRWRPATGKFERMSVTSSPSEETVAPLKALAQQMGLEDVRCLLTDREGGLWFGTEFDGLFRLLPRRFVILTRKDGLLHDFVSSISEGPDGSLWLATKLGINQFREGRLVSSHPGEVQGHPPDRRLVHVDQSGGVWTVKEPGILLHLQDGRFAEAPFRPESPRARPLIRAFYEDPEGKLWLGADGELWVREKGQWRLFPLPEPNRFKSIRSIHRDRHGDLWLGCRDNGVFRLSHDQLFAFDAPGARSAWVFHEDDEGTLWVGGNSGLDRIRNGRRFTFTTEHGLYDSFLSDILEDTRGFFWISCRRGVYRVSRQELNDVAEGKRKSVDCVVYGESDGMASCETTGAAQPAGCKTQDGTLWIPTTKGVVVINPKNIQDNPVLPSVIIEHVRANNEIVWGDGSAAAIAGEGENTQIESNVQRSTLNAQPTTGKNPRLEIRNRKSKIEVPPGHARVLAIRYTATSLVDPWKMRFKYRLDGYDADWQEGEPLHREAVYNNLRPGHYRFHVIASNNHGAWNKAGAELAVYLAPFIWQTRLFFVVSAFLAVATVYGLHVSRVRGLARIQRLEQRLALERERARIAHDIHDDLGSRLSQLAVLGELAHRNLANPGAARPHVEKLTATSKDIFQAMDEIVWAVNPKEDSLLGLASYLREYTSEILGPAGIHCRLDFPNPVPVHILSADVRHHLFLVVKEALNNVIKHAGATEVWVRMMVRDRRLELTVEDNGRGFLIAGEAAPPPESQISQRSTFNTQRSTFNPQPSVNGNGLHNMRHRMAEIGGQFEIESRSGQGTNLRLALPL